MLDEIKKSINSNLYERTRSPLYGTLIISWCIWNWKLLYYILTVDSKTPVFTRIDCIQNEIISNWTLFFGPAISTLVILVVFEFIANYAYWLHVYYKTWRANKKIKMEGKQLLSYEQSLKLRNDIRQKEEEYEKLIQEKEHQLKSLEDSIKLRDESNSSGLQEKEEITNQHVKEKKVDLLYKKLLHDKKVDTFKQFSSDILNITSLDSASSDVKEFVTLGLIKKGDYHSGNTRYYYTLTEAGKELHDMLLFN